MLPVIEHAADALEQAGWSPEIIVLLQPTSPLRRGAHIHAAIDALDILADVAVDRAHALREREAHGARVLLERAAG